MLVVEKDNYKPGAYDLGAQGDRLGQAEERRAMDTSYERMGDYIGLEQNGSGKIGNPIERMGVGNAAGQVMSDGYRADVPMLGSYRP